MGRANLASFFFFSVPIRAVVIDGAGAVSERGSILGAGGMKRANLAPFFFFTVPIRAVVIDITLTIVHRRGIGWACSVFATLLTATRCKAVFVCRTVSTDAQRFT